MKSRLGWKLAGMIFAVSTLWLAILSPAAHPATLYVTNQGDNTISVINTASRKVVKTVRVNGVKPHNGAISKDGATLYVANVGTGTVSVFDTKTMAEVATLPAGKGCHGVTLSPGGGEL